MIQQLTGKRAEPPAGRELLAPGFLLNQHRKSRRSSAGEPGRCEEQTTEPLLQRDDVRRPVEPPRRERLTSADLQSCLEKIQALNPAFPVQSVFSSLQMKSRHELQEASGGSSHPDSSQRKCGTESRERLPKRPRSGPRAGEAAAGFCFGSGQDVRESCVLALKQQRKDRKLSRSHRLKQSERLHPTTSDSQRASCSEDRLWTDKYCPQHSDQLIGNSASVSKLHSWLESWKRSSDAEESRQRDDGEHKGSWDCGDFQGEAGMENGGEEPLRNTVLLTGPSGVGKTSSVYACAQELGFQVEPAPAC